MPRNRGAQPGNRNALKHGYYSPLFRSAELKNLKALSNPGLSDEIEMLRLVICRIVERASDETLTFDQHLRYLNAISHATAQLSRLIRTQALLVGEVDQIEKALIQALQVLNNETPSPSPP
ncbi:MAG: hypothetical protein U9R58_05580 [Chloroflexota bacterium]|nr:hypothetical protein [Chloroflexota bacterium]